MGQKYEDIMKRTEWFRNDRFGMFIHFGLYAIPARGEWVQNRERIEKEKYYKYFEMFNPIDFDARKWVRLAKQAGMKYVVLTAKHHDGFCLFDSKYTDFKSTNTQFGRDIVKEFLDACREEDMKAGLYYSLLDWNHEEYPKYDDAFHPMSGNVKFRDEKINFDNYIKYMFNQIEEIVTNYGKINIMWFDFSYDEMSGEKWQASKLIEMVRKHQPEIIIDNRLESSGESMGSLIEEEISEYAGDFLNPEQVLPYKPLTNKKGQFIPWEMCLTMNYNWGYSANDHSFKTSKRLIRKLVECVSKGGNMLLNVGPDAKGNIPQESIKIFEEIGEWMKYNSESIYNCGIAEFNKPEWGYFTQSDRYLYAHIFDQPIGPLPLVEIETEKINWVDLLRDYSELHVSINLFVKNYDITFIDLAEDLTSRNKENDADTVIRIELKK